MSNLPFCSGRFPISRIWLAEDMYSSVVTEIRLVYLLYFIKNRSWHGTSRNKATTQIYQTSSLSSLLLLIIIYIHLWCCHILPCKKHQSSAWLVSWRLANSTSTLAAGCSTSNCFKMVAPSLVMVTSPMSSTNILSKPRIWIWDSSASDCEKASKHDPKKNDLIPDLLDSPKQ